MRWLLVLACLIFGGCSPTVYDLPAVYAPEPSIAMDGARVGANEARLVGPVEVSATRESYPLEPGPYMLCIRGINTVTPGTYTYAVFFKNNKYITTRMSVMIDKCDAETYYLLGIGPFPPSVKQTPS